MQRVVARTLPTSLQSAAAAVRRHPIQAPRIQGHSFSLKIRDQAPFLSGFRKPGSIQGYADPESDFETPMVARIEISSEFPPEHFISILQAVQGIVAKEMKYYGPQSGPESMGGDVGWVSIFRDFLTHAMPLSVASSKAEQMMRDIGGMKLPQGRKYIRPTFTVQDSDGHANPVLVATLPLLTENMRRAIRELDGVVGVEVR